MIQLSPDQTVAVSALLTQLKQRKEAILVGAAGTGKTTTLEAFLAEWAKPENRPPGIGAEPVCVCPTWKAALRFTQVTGHESRSIHSLIYGAPDEKKGERGRRELVFDTLRDNPDVKNSLVVIDEASMVGEKTYSDLTAWAKTHRCLLLFVGDREQLEPVNSAWGVDFANPTAALTQVHRQADGSHLLDFVTRIREGTAHQFQAYGTDVNWHKGVQEPLLQRFWQEADIVSDRICITFTNQLRTGQNRVARRARGFSGDPQPGEPLLSFANRAGMVNGEIIVIESSETVAPGEDNAAGVLASILAPSDLRILRVEASMGPKRIQFYTLPASMGLYGREKETFNGDVIQAIKQDVAGELFYKWGRFTERHVGRSGPRAKRVMEAYNALADVDFGYAVTAHKAQGSQWESVFVLIEPFLNKAEGGPVFRRRWLYTAATRAEKSLTIGTI